MEQSPSYEANMFPACLIIPCILWNLDLQQPTTCFILRQTNPIHAPIPRLEDKF